MNLLPPIGVVVDAAHSYGARLLDGLISFEAEQEDWSVVSMALPPTMPGEAFVRLPFPLRGLVVASWGPGGSPPDAVEPATPVIDACSSTWPRPEWPSVKHDDHAIGVLAAEILLGQGYRNFACAWLRDPRFSELRRDGFRDRLREEGIKPACWCSVSGIPVVEQARPWLASLPELTGVFAVNDLRGRRIIEAAIQAGRKVPEDIGVLGVDDDPIEQAGCPVPLASVRPDFEAVGREAGRMLRDLLDGRRPDPDHLLIPPRGVAIRTSCRLGKPSDLHVGRAVEFIREHRGLAIRVPDVCRAAGISRRPLERRFREIEGMTIHERILQECLAEAAHLLTETDLPVARIAETCGYRDPKHFTRVFRSRHGLPPAAYRKRGPVEEREDHG